MTAERTILAILLLIILGMAGGFAWYINDNEQYNRRLVIEKEQIFLETEQVKDGLKVWQDSISREVQKERAYQKFYRDSVAFMDLSRVMCYDNKPHRHSCEIFK